MELAAISSRTDGYLDCCAVFLLFAITENKCSCLGSALFEKIPKAFSAFITLVSLIRCFIAFRKLLMHTRREPLRNKWAERTSPLRCMVRQITFVYFASFPSYQDVPYFSGCQENLSSGTPANFPMYWSRFITALPAIMVLLHKFGCPISSCNLY